MIISVRLCLGLLMFGGVPGILAIDRCSHSIVYQDLCPNPMLVGRSSGFSIVETDMEINLTRQHNGTCEFYKNENEVTNIGGIHVNHYPWSFSKASTCTHVVKLVLDRDSYNMFGNQKSVCDKKLGIKLHDCVTMWHNFTMNPNHLTYDDIISDYGHSPFDLQCTHSKKFVLMLFETYQDSKCTLVVQQYRVNDRRNNCEHINKPPLQYRFCGAYPCSQTNSVLHELKLITRRGPSISNSNVDNSPTSVSEEEGGHVEGLYAGPEIPNPVSLPGGTLKAADVKRSGGGSGGPYGPPLPTTEEPTTTTSGVLGDPKPIDYLEWAVRLFFPALGVVFIIVILRILKERYPDELCVKHPITTKPYLGSILSLDKHGLKM